MCNRLDKIFLQQDHMNNPFDLDNYVRQLHFADANHDHKISIQQTAVVNRRRAKGVEPSSPYSAKGRDSEPEKFSIAMPKLAKYDKNAARRQRTKDKLESTIKKNASGVSRGGQIKVRGASATAITNEDSV
jgi:hypothetical protein